jgi:hypothetical protein
MNVWNIPVSIVDIIAEMIVVVENVILIILILNLILPQKFAQNISILKKCLKSKKWGVASRLSPK